MDFADVLAAGAAGLAAEAAAGGAAGHAAPAGALHGEAVLFLAQGNANQLRLKKKAEALVSGELCPFFHLSSPTRPVLTPPSPPSLARYPLRAAGD